MREIPIAAVPHMDYGDPECSGLIFAVERGGYADLTCNECGLVISTVPGLEAEQALMQMSMALGMCSESCPQCGPDESVPRLRFDARVHMPILRSWGPDGIGENFSAARHYLSVTDLERSHAELRASLILAGQEIRKLQFGHKNSPLLRKLREVLKDARAVAAGARARPDKHGSLPGSG